MKLQYRDDGDTDWRVHLKTNKEAPLTQRTLRFAANHENGLTSHPWKIEAQANGEVYIRGRNVFGELHASLHASGQSHIKYVAHERSSDVCQWKWSYNVPCLHILFLPKWGTPIADRPDRNLWDRNDFLLGTDDNWGVAVTLVRMKDNEVPAPPLPPLLLFNLARIRMADAEATLWVVAGQIYPPCDPGELDRFIRQASSQVELKGKATEGQVLDLELHGLYTANAGFMVPLQAKLHQGNPAA